MCIQQANNPLKDLILALPDTKERDRARMIKLTNYLYDAQRNGIGLELGSDDYIIPHIWLFRGQRAGSRLLSEDERTLHQIHIGLDRVRLRRNPYFILTAEKSLLSVPLHLGKPRIRELNVGMGLFPSRRNTLIRYAPLSECEVWHRF
jgi:hypothetical protein